MSVVQEDIARGRIGGDRGRPACVRLSKSKRRTCLRTINFWGSRSPAVVKNWMNRAMVFCTPSLTAESGDAEGFGMVFAEAQAMGLPVVSFASGGIPEVVADRQTGFLVRERDWQSLADKTAGPPFRRGSLDPIQRVQAKPAFGRDSTSGNKPPLSKISTKAFWRSALLVSMRMRPRCRQARKLRIAGSPVAIKSDRDFRRTLLTQMRTRYHTVSAVIPTRNRADLVSAGCAQRTGTDLRESRSDRSHRWA